MHISHTVICGAMNSCGVSLTDCVCDGGRESLLCCLGAFELQPHFLFRGQGEGLLAGRLRGVDPSDHANTAARLVSEDGYGGSTAGTHRCLLAV